LEKKFHMMVQKPPSRGKGGPIKKEDYGLLCEVPVIPEKSEIGRVGGPILPPKEKKGPLPFKQRARKQAVEKRTKTKVGFLCPCEKKENRLNWGGGGLPNLGKTRGGGGSEEGG